MGKRIVIVGGGVIGLASAWYLRQSGHDVTVVEKSPEQRDGSSFGNAGMLVPSHFVPLAAPGMVQLGLKWLWRRDSPFAIQPRWSWELLSWLWQFQRHCNRKHVERSAPLLRDLHLQSRECFQQLQQQIGDFGLVNRGLLMLCKSEAMLREESEAAELARRVGIEAEVLDPAGLKQLEPAVEMDVQGGVHFPQDCYLDPRRLMELLQRRLQQDGCEFLWDTHVHGFRTDSDRVVAVKTDHGEVAAEEIVLCGGSWTTHLAAQLNLRLPMQSGKGYSLTLAQPPQLPSVGTILTEARVAVTPIGSSLRVAGTMEVVGLDESISRRRVEGIIKSVPRYFPQFREQDFTGMEPWVGLRPVSPDGLPYLGRTQRWRNVVVATGHAMMGISLAMISGRIAADAINGKPPTIENLQQLAPDRYTK